MLRCNNEETAYAFARERGLCYGLSCLRGVAAKGGAWYVGTRDQLIAIGVPNVRDPREVKPC